MARILVVDDDPDDVFLVRTAFSAAGHEVVATHRPEEAVSAAFGNQVEAVVLDVVMPGLTGFNVLHALRAHALTRDLPILLLSGIDEGPFRVQGLREGADDYLAKPFDVDELVARVERLLVRAGARGGAAPRAAPSLDEVTAELERREQARRAGRQEAPRVVCLGRYQVLERLGGGGMGVVFRGWDPRLERAVALKTLRLDRLELRSSPVSSVAQLLSEAIVGARLHHPNIVAVYDVGETSDAAFLAMELIAGTSLDRYLAVKERLSADEAVPLGAALARGLAAAHAREVVHRDVTPGNVLLGDDGSVKLTDFGLAGLIEALGDHFEQIYGTPGFVPPESLLEMEHGPEGDLFSLGVILYRCLAGRMPFDGGTMFTALYETAYAEPPPLKEVAPRVPGELAELVHRMLEKRPAARPDAVEAARRLDAMSAERRLSWVLDPGLPVAAGTLEERPGSQWIATGSLAL